MGLFGSLKDLVTSRLKGENNFTMYANNITFIVKYCHEKYLHRFESEKDILILSGYVNMQYYMQHSSLKDYHLKHWADAAMMKKEFIDPTVITHFVKNVEKFAFKDQYANDANLYMQVNDAVDYSEKVIYDECSRVFYGILKPEKNLHKDYVNDIDSILKSNNLEMKQLRSFLNINEL